MSADLTPATARENSLRWRELASQWQSISQGHATAAEIAHDWSLIADLLDRINRTTRDYNRHDAASGGPRAERERQATSGE